jgi:hypothetical protein
LHVYGALVNACSGVAVTDAVASSMGGGCTAQGGHPSYIVRTVVIHSIAQKCLVWVEHAPACNGSRRAGQHWLVSLNPIVAL